MRKNKRYEKDIVSAINIILTTDDSYYIIKADNLNTSVPAWVDHDYNNSPNWFWTIINICPNVISSNTTERISIITNAIGKMLGLADDPPVSYANESLMYSNRNYQMTYSPRPYDLHNVRFIYGE